MIYRAIQQPTSPSFPLLSERTSVEPHSSAPAPSLAGTGEVGWGCLLKDKGELDLKNPLTKQRTREKKIFIQYNRAYIEYARENRKNSTKAENIFWYILKDRKFLWYKFRRQKCIWPFILDFYSSELLLWIELDGWYHNDTIDYDRHRDAEIYKKGILVIRFRNEDIEKNLEWVVSELKQIIKERWEMLL